MNYVKVLYLSIAFIKRLGKQVDSLDKRLASMQEELEALRRLQKETYEYIITFSLYNIKLLLLTTCRLQNEANKSKHRRKRSSKPVGSPTKNSSSKSVTDSATLNNSDTDMYNSALSTDMDNSSEEFYDLSTDTEDEKTSSVVEVMYI